MSIAPFAIVRRPSMRMRLQGKCSKCALRHPQRRKVPPKSPPCVYKENVVGGHSQAPSNDRTTLYLYDARSALLALASPLSAIF